jgi:hypothetical protein
METQKEYVIACERLNISLKRLNNITSKEEKINCIKKCYYKLALRHHPDKGGDSTEFKKIKEAYDFIIKHETDNESNVYIKEDNDTFEGMFVSFVESIIKNRKGFERFDKLFIKTTLHSILKKCDVYSIKVFSQLDLEKCKQIYDFLSQHKDVFFLSDEQLLKYKEIIQNKMKNNNIILLNPSIDDILSDNIYKLELEDDTHYIPLWHNEIIVDDMIIKNIPDISSNISINDNHDIIIKQTVSIVELFENGKLGITVGNKNYNVHSDQVKITKDIQFILFKEQGKLIPNSNNLYENKKRGNVIVELTLSVV